MRPKAAHHPLVLTGPTALFLSLFFAAPVFASAALSFFEWDLLTPPRFVGWENYRELLLGAELARIGLRTLSFSALVVSVGTSLGLGLALLLRRPGVLFALARGAIFSAYVVSWVAVALLWLWLLDPDAGLLARVLARVGLPRLMFLTDPDLALVTLAMVTVWKTTGYAMVIFLGALDAIPKALSEAAALDGAGPFARFRFVILPELRPTAAFVVTTSLVASFQAFDVVRIMTQGGPAKATTLFVYAIYEQIFLNLSVGKASALATAFLLLLVTLSWLNLRLFRERGARA
ncbi:MAG: sugar ABC transporter permease [Myxococcales bacterium]|nr:sugar ABC transporter permease [Myxococcales bacterium]